MPWWTIFTINGIFFLSPCAQEKTKVPLGTVYYLWEGGDWEIGWGADIFADEKGGDCNSGKPNPQGGGALKLRQDKNKNKEKNKKICKNHLCPRSHK